MAIFRLIELLAEPSTPTQGFVSTGAAYGLFYAALIVVCGIAVFWPYFAKKVKSYLHPEEEFTTARSSQPWWSISCSFFSSSLGCWVLTAPVEIAQEYSLWGIIGYALATSVPWVAVAFFGPRMRSLTDGKGFSNIDYIKIRLGSVAHIVYALTSFLAVFGGYVVECISLSQILQAVSPDTKAYVFTASVVTGVFLYTCISGMQATLLTDRFQLCAISLTIILASVGVFHYAVNVVHTSEETQGVSSLRNRMFWSKDGFISLIVLNISCMYPTFMDPASWSRMYAARSEADARLGLLVAAGLLVIPMIIFGFMGLVAGAAMDDKLIEDPSIFSTLTLLHPWWNGVIIVLATLLSTSTVDTMSSAITNFVVANFAAFQYTINVNIARLITLALSVVGLVLVIKNPPSVMTLFMCCNLITTCTTTGLLLSLWDFVTPAGVLSGVFGSALAVCSYGWAYYGTFKGGFDWWLFPEGSANLTALYTFLVTGLTALVLTVGVSQLEFWLRPQSRELQQLKFVELKKGGQEECNTEEENRLTESSQSAVSVI